MIEKYDIAGYCRISVDEEGNRDNVSIENQKAIIADFVKEKFPNSNLEFFEDRDRSGYTFEQREGYQTMRKQLFSHKKDILIIKDFSRFSRRNSRGLCELEDLRDAGVRIISIGDNTDFPNDDDWLKIQFQFIVNEIPVTETSKKVKDIINRRQKDANWICAVPYGYIINKKHQIEIVPEQAEVVRKIFELYIAGYGYKKIANFLTNEKIPTPRTAERDRKEANEEPYNREVKNAWSNVTVQGILDNDFYIGTLRQRKYTRKKINGTSVKCEEEMHLVFEKNHQETIDYKTFLLTKSLREQRSKSNYRGVKINENAYSGLLFCGDCGSPMFAMSRSDIKQAYRCGEYHKRGLHACTSHHIRVEKLDELMKIYVAKVKENSAEMLERLNADLEKEVEQLNETHKSEVNLTEVLNELQAELTLTKRQRIRDILKNPEREDSITEVYDELEDNLLDRIEGLKNQICLNSDRRNTIINVNRIAKTALDVFDDILDKEHLDKSDLQIIVEKIKVYENRIVIELKADIDQILNIKNGVIDVPLTANFPKGIVNIVKNNANSTNNLQITQSSYGKKDKVYDVNVVSNGDPLEIYTSNDGEVIFKKYSAVNEMQGNATQIAEVITRLANCPAIVFDRDHVVAVAGAQKKEFSERRVSAALEDYLENRKNYTYTTQNDVQMYPIEGVDKPAIACAPIVSSGDVTGAVAFLAPNENAVANEVQKNLVLAAAQFLGKQIEE